MRPAISIRVPAVKVIKDRVGGVSSASCSLADAASDCAREGKLRGIRATVSCSVPREWFFVSAFSSSRFVGGGASSAAPDECLGAFALTWQFASAVKNRATLAD
jgi:hypothetical protein